MLHRIRTFVKIARRSRSLRPPCPWASAAGNPEHLAHGDQVWVIEIVGCDKGLHGDAGSSGDGAQGVTRLDGVPASGGCFRDGKPGDIKGGEVDEFRGARYPDGDGLPGGIEIEGDTCRAALLAAADLSPSVMLSRSSSGR